MMVLPGFIFGSPARQSQNIAYRFVTELRYSVTFRTLRVRP
jgi:hypothetical protein